MKYILAKLKLVFQLLRREYLYTQTNIFSKRLIEMSTS